MNCTRTRQMLDAWIDQELDEQTASALMMHCTGCPTCATLKGDRETTRNLVREMPRYAAPPGLKQDVLRNLRRAGETPGRLVSLRRAWSMAMAGAAAGALATFLLNQVPLMPDSTPELAVARHVAALASGGGLQVESGDRHTIKPWFQGKVDFSPPVRDLAADGFTLLGARLDRIGSHPAAAIVYRIRNHPIDLYVWPAAANQSTPLQVAIHRGFGIAYWSGHGLHFAAISDVDRRDLERFALLIQPP